MAIKITGTDVIDNDRRYINNENLPDIAPTLMLDFANSKTLGSRVDFSRASTATYYDGETMVKSEENLFAYSESLTSHYPGYFQTNGTNFVTPTPAIASAPNGTSTADAIVPGAGTALTAFYIANKAYPQTGSTVVISVYAKAYGYNFIKLFNGASSNASAYFNLSNGTVGSTGGTEYVSASIDDVGSGWYRCSLVSAHQNTSYAYGLYVSDQDYPTQVTSGPSITANGTSGVFAWGFQLEQRDALSAYTPVNGTPITNYIHAMQTAASGEARFDHDPVTRESLGYLCEEQRTNLITDTNGSYAASAGITVDNNVLIAPDGNRVADIIRESTSTGEHYTDFSVSVTTGTVYAYSAYYKADPTVDYTGVTIQHRVALQGLSASAYFAVSASGEITLSSYTSYSSVSINHVGNGWYRVVAITPAATGTGNAVFRRQIHKGGNVYTGDGYTGYGTWGAQVEVGSFATSLIPTSGSTATRIADSASITGTNFSDWYRQDEGTLYAESQLFNVYSNIDQFPRTLSLVGDNVNTDSIAFYHQITSTTRQVNASVARNGTAEVGMILKDTTPDGFSKMSMAFATNDVASVASNGTGTQTDTTVVLPSITGLRIFGQVRYQIQPSGRIKKIAYYPKRLPNATLQAMTEE